MADGGSIRGESAFDSRRVQPCKQTTSKRALGCVYMMAFNLLCSYAWIKVLLAVVEHMLNHGLPDVLLAWSEIERPLFFAQSLALLEIMHTLLGLVRSNFWTTLMQVFSRLQLVWVLFPSVSASRESIALISCVTAWSCAELLRFPFFSVQQLLQLIDMMRNDPVPLEVPVLLKWLRYSGFTVLYPIGITSEVVCMCSSLTTLRDSSVFAHYPVPMPNKLNFELSLHWAYLVILGLYIPGSVQLYGHMLKQRKKYLYGAGQEATPKKEN